MDMNRFYILVYAIFIKGVIVKLNVVGGKEMTKEIHPGGMKMNKDDGVQNGIKDRVEKYRDVDMKFHHLYKGSYTYKGEADDGTVIILDGGAMTYEDAYYLELDPEYKLGEFIDDFSDYVVKVGKDKIMRISELV